MHIQTLTGEWHFRQTGSGEWPPAQVPGSVHVDLLSAGQIPDPFVADKQKQVMWVAERDWAYRRTFTVDAAVDPDWLAWVKERVRSARLDSLGFLRLPVLCLFTATGRL